MYSANRTVPCDLMNPISLVMTVAFDGMCSIKQNHRRSFFFLGSCLIRGTVVGPGSLEIGRHLLEWYRERECCWRMLAYTLLENAAHAKSCPALTEPIDNDDNNSLNFRNNFTYLGQFPLPTERQINR